MEEDNLFHRQVHPNFVVPGNIISSQAFMPTAKDENKLSVYDDSILNAEDSYEHYTETLGLKSSGVVSVTKTECEQIDLSCETDNSPFNGHAFIDFKDLDRKEAEKKAKQLKNFASKRGWQFKK